MSGRKHCIVPSEVAKQYQDGYQQHQAGVKSSTALILENRPRSVLLC